MCFLNVFDFYYIIILFYYFRKTLNIIVKRKIKKIIKNKLKFEL